MKRCFALTVTSLITLLCSTSPTLAQTVSGSIPRAESPQTWQRPDGGCSGITPVNPTTRRFNLAKFTLNGAGNYTLTATRSDGGFIALDAYGSFFAGATPGYECSNRDNYGAPSGMGSVSDTLSCTGSICSSGGFVTEVVISVGPTDSVPITFTVSGGPAVTFSCGTYTTASFTPNSQTIPSAGGSFSTVYSPGSSLGCSPSWTSSGVPSWITGFASSGTGAQTINYSAASNSTGSTRNATISIGSASLSLSQPSGASCSYAFASSSASVSAAGGTQSVNMNTTSGCAWTASSSTPWLSGVTASGSGTGAIGYTAAANSGPARSGTITSQGKTFTVNQADGCTISLTPATASVSAAAGTGLSASLSTGAGCAWTLGSSAGFVSGFAASGTGPSTINYDVAANTSVARSATLTARLTASGATDTLVVNQADGCTASVSPTTINADGSAHTENVTLTLSNAACSFSTSTTGGFITPSPSGGSGSQTISLALTANSGAARSGSASIAGQTVSVNQASVCTISVDPTANVGAAMGSGSFAIATQAGCAWTVGGSAGFVTGFATSGTGPATINYDYAQNLSVARSAMLTAMLTATGASATHVVNQASGCTASLSAASATPSAAAGSDSVDITLSDAACPWSAISNASWLTVPTASGTGNATLGFDYAANSGPERTGTLTIGGQTFDVTQASGCVVSVPASQSVMFAGGSGTLAVTTAAGCPWTASTTTSWLSNVTASGTGPGTIDFAYAANVGPARTGTISVASSTTASTAAHSIVQGDGCVAMLASAGDNFGAGATSSSVMLTLSAASCAWMASSSAGWLTVDAGALSGMGSAVIGFAVAENVSVARNATLTIAGQTFDVAQASGCAITLTPTSGTAPAAGDTLSFDLATDAACAWTATESLGWISGLTASGTGPVTIALSADKNLGPMRTGDVVFTATDSGASATYAASQADGCVATLASDTLNVAAAGESGSVGVTLSSQSCPWSTTADAFISVSNDSGTGDATLMFDVGSNLGPERTGTITVSGKTFTITQANGCAVALTPESASKGVESGTTQFELQTAPGCTWTATTGDDWMTGFADSGTGPDKLDVDFSANTGPTRGGTIDIAVSSGATASFALTQSDGCLVTLPVDSAEAAASGGSSSFAVMRGDGCAYTVASDASWVDPTVSDTGVEYGVDAWDGAQRTAQITVTSTTSDSSATFTLTQKSGCALMLMPGDTRVGAQGETISLQVKAGEGCEISAATDSDFISGIAVDGTTIEADIAQNQGDERMGIIVVSAGDSMGEFVVQQDAAAAVGPDGGVVDGGVVDGGLAGGEGVDGGVDFKDLELGGGCNCSVPGHKRSLPHGLAALFVGLVLALRLRRRRRRR